jgi:hypothetical protein
VDDGSKGTSRLTVGVDPGDRRRTPYFQALI